MLSLGHRIIIQLTRMHAHVIRLLRAHRVHAVLANLHNKAATQRQNETVDHEGKDPLQFIANPEWITLIPLNRVFQGRLLLGEELERWGTPGHEVFAHAKSSLSFCMGSFGAQHSFCGRSPRAFRSAVRSPPGDGSPRAGGTACHPQTHSVTCSCRRHYRRSRWTALAPPVSALATPS